MESTGPKKGSDNHLPSSISEPTVTIQNPPTVILDGQSLKLKQDQVQEALAIARKNLTDEDFLQAISIVDALLQTQPDLEEAKSLRNQIQLASSNRSREMFDRGVNSYMECDWDRAITFWKKTLQIDPDDGAAVDWIVKAEHKKEQEKLIRAELLQDLETCGRMLSERNYVIAEEHLETLKNKFARGFRLADLQRIYEALVVRTRVELDKEFEDLRSNVIEPVHPAPVEKQASSNRANAGEQQLQKKYMDAFEAGKKCFENGQWQRALVMWQTARRINPHDQNLTHWIALAENSALQVRPYAKQSPVRATIAFLSVFVVTALITYLAYEKYVAYEKQTKNQILIQRAIEHYRAGRLEESWKFLQIYVLQDPENESARALLERITAEMKARQGMEHLNRIAAQLEVATYLYERNQKESAAIVLNRLLTSNPDQPEAKQLLSRIRGNVSVPKASIEIRIQPAARLWIDGRDLGINSYFNPMESIGPHIIHVELQGFRSLDQGVDVKSSDKNQFQFHLKPM